MFQGNQRLESINEKVMKSLQFCNLPVVEMGGDLFYLTIPTKTAMIDMENCEALEQEHVLEQLFAYKYLTFDIRYGQILLFKANEASQLVRYGLDGISAVDWGKYSTLEFAFVPALIPLTRDGSVDMEFSKSVPTGEIIHAGHLFCSNGNELLPECKQSFSRVDAPIELTENGHGSKPLSWVSAGGILIGTSPVGKTIFAELWASNLIPQLSEKIPDNEQTASNKQTQFLGPSANPVGSITMQTTGDPDLDDILKQIMTQKHPLENKKFCIGREVKVIADDASLRHYLLHKLESRPLEVLGIMDMLKNHPVELIGINDLSEEDGTVNPYATVMTNNGFAYPLPVNFLVPA